MSSNKDFRQLIKKAEAQGWQVGQTNGGHLRWVSPEGKVVFSAFSPSDRRAVHNVERELKLKGFILIKQKGKK